MNKENIPIIIYQTEDGVTKIETRLEDETVWLTIDQMAELFQKSRSTINEHILNIYEEKELDTEHSMRKIGNSDFSTKPTNFYNLDVIISVGYRVKSHQGTKFRQWATARLKDFLIRGYAMNQKRLDELSQTVSIIAKSMESYELKPQEAKGVLNLLSNYTQSYILLNQFDSNNLKTNNLDTNITYEISYEDAKPEIKALKQKLIDLKEATSLFGNEKDDSFQGILGNILQTFDGQYLYPSIEEQAAHLLYFVVKNHPFTDGNKRIGAFLFIWFLEKNKHRLDKNGNIKINEYGLVALTLLVAQSNPSDKDLMIHLIINLIKNWESIGT